MQSDYAGHTIPIIDPSTGNIHSAQIFVAILPASSLTFACASLSQKLPDWIEGQERALSFFGGVPKAIVCDNLKAGVAKALWFEPTLNATFAAMAEHYDTTILPTRSRKPRDKAKVEGAVLIVERWILARLRNRRFFSLVDLNAVISALLDDLNSRPMRHIGKSRRELFEDVERKALAPLPETPFDYAEWKSAKVHPDYHVEVDKTFYSVPHRLVSEEVTLRVTASMVEIFHKRERVASHERSRVEGGTTTDKAHQPDNHRAWGEQTPERYRSWASGIGPNALELINAQFEGRHPALAMRACSSLHGLAKTHGTQRFEDACREALRIKSPVCKSVRSILQNRLERRGQEATDAAPALPAHSNVRGPDYYAKEAVNAD